MREPPRYIAHRSSIGMADRSEDQTRPGQRPTNGAAELRPLTTTGDGRQPRHAALARPHIAGKFLARGAKELYLRGVTYGPFEPDSGGVEYQRSAVRNDFTAMAADSETAAVWLT